MRFRRELLDLVLKGRKRVTIRATGGSEYARELVLTDGRRRVPARLVSVRSLTLRSALRYYRKEGLRSPGELRVVLRRIYPDIGPHSRVTLIEFRPSRQGRRRAAENGDAS